MKLHSGLTDHNGALGTESFTSTNMLPVTIESSQSCIKEEIQSSISQPTHRDCEDFPFKQERCKPEFDLVIKEEHISSNTNLLAEANIKTEDVKDESLKAEVMSIRGSNHAIGNQKNISSRDTYPVALYQNINVQEKSDTPSDAMETRVFQKEPSNKEDQTPRRQHDQSRNCQKTFTKSSYLTRNMRRHSVVRKIKIKNGKRISCEYRITQCERHPQTESNSSENGKVTVYRSKTFLANKKITSGKNGHRCSQKFGTNSSKQKVHLGTSTHFRAHGCPTCGKVFAKASYLKLHKLTHKFQTNRSSDRFCGKLPSPHSGLMNEQRKENNRVPSRKSHNNEVTPNKTVQTDIKKYPGEEIFDQVASKNVSHKTLQIYVRKLDNSKGDISDQTKSDKVVAEPRNTDFNKNANGREMTMNKRLDTRGFVRQTTPLDTPGLKSER